METKVCNERLNLQQAVATCMHPQKLLCLQEKSKIVDNNILSDIEECSSTTTGPHLSLDHWIEWQRAPVSIGHIGHSSTTNMLVNVLQFTENVSDPRFYHEIRYRDADVLKPR